LHLPVGLDQHSPGNETEKAGTQVSPVTMSPRSLCTTLFAAVYKRPTEGGLGAFAFCLGLFVLMFLGALALVLA
jgi:hypothetical protein